MRQSERGRLQEQLNSLRKEREETDTRAREFRLSMYIEEERSKKLLDQIEILQYELDKTSVSVQA